MPADASAPFAISASGRLPNVLTITSSGCCIPTLYAAGKTVGVIQHSNLHRRRTKFGGAWSRGRLWEEARRRGEWGWQKSGSKLRHSKEGYLSVRAGASYAAPRDVADSLGRMEAGGWLRRTSTFHWS